MNPESVRLTQFSPGAGCGCKISPKDLELILRKSSESDAFPGLLVGNETKDDAAVLDIGNGKALISTTDFFTPVVDDPFDFGRIAAVNAISDIYAMGGTPVLAIAVLGWPLDKLPAEVASEVVSGARKICNDIGIPLAGGHSIGIADPVFGLAVNGLVDIQNIRQNSTAGEGNLIYLTKPLGIGILTTAQKKGMISEEHYREGVSIMTTLNKAGEIFGRYPYVRAMTDVTGFGLLGHLAEMCEGSGLDAEIEFMNIPVIGGLGKYIAEKCIPGGTHKNWKSYQHKIGPIEENQRFLLCDPQTSGGLLVAVDQKETAAFEKTCADHQIFSRPIGRFTGKHIQGPHIHIR
jgi:selenide, water dikinase